MTPLEARFWAALSRLETWYADPVKAMSLDGRTSSSKPGATILRVGRYPDADQWRYLWRTARNDGQRESVVGDMEKECDRLGRLPKPEMKLDGKRYWLLESGDYHGMDYRTAAEDLGLEERTVWEWRKAKGLEPRKGREKKVA